MAIDNGWRVICVGAGITGLSVAIALREHVASITLLESADSHDNMNVRAAGLGLYTNAATILRDVLGVDPLRDIKAVPGHTIRQLNWDGSLDREVVPSSTDWYMAHRGALLDALLNKATSKEGKGKPAEILFGKRALEVDADIGTVTTTDGSTYTADLIVGTEGVRSVTRRAIVSSIVSPSGLSVYRFTLPASFWTTSNLSATNKAHIEASFAPTPIINSVSDDPKQGLRLVMYKCHQDGTINGLLLFPDNRLTKGHTGEDWSAAGSVSHMHELVEDLADPWRSLVRQCVHSCGLWQLRHQKPLRTWHRGRAIVLGDAAHPMSPFQAAAGALAIEDAEALRFALEEQGFDRSKEAIERALDKVFRVRWMRCSLIQHFSNASPFDDETMEMAARWSAERAREQEGKGGSLVPVAQEGAEDPVQKYMVEIVGKYSGMFDRKVTSTWVWDYKGAKDWVERKGEYVLQKPFA